MKSMLPVNRIKARVAIVMGAHWRAQMGGAQYQAGCLAEALVRDSDAEVTYLARLTPPAETFNGYPVVRIGRGRPLGWLRFLGDIYPLFMALRRISPTVIYQRGLKVYTGVCALFCRLFGVRFVFHAAHDDDVRRFSTRSDEGTGIVARIEGCISRYGLRRAQSIVVQTTDQARMLVENYGILATAIVPNFHPVPSERVERDWYGLLRVIWVANFKPVKRPEIFVELAERFAGRPGVEFVMIGRYGEPKRYDELHSRIGRLHNMKYFGELPLERVNEEISRSHIFVNTSASEGFPNTFIQAWMRGVPVLSVSVDPDKCLSIGGAGKLAIVPDRLSMLLDDFLVDREELIRVSEVARSYGMRHHGPLQAGSLLGIVLDQDAPTAKSGVRQEGVGR